MSNTIEQNCDSALTSVTAADSARPWHMIDLFAGIGGIRLGFERAFSSDKNGVKCVFTSEWDKHAVKTYKANFGDEEVAGDITQVDAADIPSFDICLAGFPCQAFSAAGKRQGFEDDYKGRCRGTLFREVARIVEHHSPAVIFCENVKGLVGHDKGNTFATIKRTFEELGYTVFSKVLNSADFGVAQNRERIYIVAFRNDVAPDEFSFPEPTCDSAVIKDILDDAPIPAKYYLSDTYLTSLRKHRARQEAKGHGFGYVIRDLNGKSGTVVCGGSGREGNLVIGHREHSLEPTTNIKGKINDEDVRVMTPREWARLQGFPDDYKIPVSDTQAYKQFGNSVTVPVIEAIASEILSVLPDAEGAKHQHIR